MVISENEGGGMSKEMHISKQFSRPGHLRIWSCII